MPSTYPALAGLITMATTPVRAQTSRYRAEVIAVACLDNERRVSAYFELEPSGTVPHVAASSIWYRCTDARYCAVARFRVFRSVAEFPSA